MSGRFLAPSATPISNGKCQNGKTEVRTALTLTSFLDSLLIRSNIVACIKSCMVDTRAVLSNLQRCSPPNPMFFVTATGMATEEERLTDTRHRRQCRGIITNKAGAVWTDCHVAAISILPGELTCPCIPSGVRLGFFVAGKATPAEQS